MPSPRPISRNPPSHRYQCGVSAHRFAARSAAVAGLFKNFGAPVQSSPLPSSVSSQALQAIPAGTAPLEKKMRNTQGNEKSMNSRARTALVLAVIVGISLTGCAHAMGMMRGVRRPAITEFGLGPRTSANGLYVATLQPERALKPRQLMTVGVTIADASGRPVEDATITIDGGMPEHGHGLPTRPRM